MKQWQLHSREEFSAAGRLVAADQQFLFGRVAYACPARPGRSRIYAMQSTPAPFITPLPVVEHSDWLSGVGQDRLNHRQSARRPVAGKNADPDVIDSLPARDQPVDHG